MPLRKILLAIVIAMIVVLNLALDLGRHFSLDAFKSQQAAIENWYAAQTLMAALPCFLASRFHAWWRGA